MTLRVRSSRPRRSFDDHGPAHLRGVTFHVRPGKQRGDPRAVLQANAHSSEQACFGTLVSIHRVAPYGAFASCSQLTRSRPWPSSLAFAGPILLRRIERRVTARHLSVNSSSQSRISIDSSLLEVEVRCCRSVHPSRDASSSIRSLSRSPDPFGYPNRSSPRSPHGDRGRSRFFHSEVLERGSSMSAFRRSRSLRFDHPLGGRGRVRSFSSHLSVQKVRSACTPASAFIVRVHARSPCDDRARSRRRSPLCVRDCFTSVHLAMNRRACIRARLATLACAKSRPVHLSAFEPALRSRTTSVAHQPPSMFARLTALGHFRRRWTTAAALTFLMHQRHLAMPSTHAFVLTSRRSCSRSHA